jgi:hypothetical protein
MGTPQEVLLIDHTKIYARFGRHQVLGKKLGKTSETPLYKGKMVKIHGQVAVELLTYKDLGNTIMYNHFVTSDKLTNNN